MLTAAGTGIDIGGIMMRKTKSAIHETVHKTAKGLHAAGVMELVTLREFDRLCLPSVEPLSTSKIRKNRCITICD